MARRRLPRASCASQMATCESKRRSLLTVSFWSTVRGRPPISYGPPRGRSWKPGNRAGSLGYSCRLIQVSHAGSGRSWRDWLAPRIRVIGAASASGRQRSADGTPPRTGLSQLRAGNYSAGSISRANSRCGSKWRMAPPLPPRTFGTSRNPRGCSKFRQVSENSIL